MRAVSIVLALTGLAAGLYAALKWFQSSRVEVDLGYSLPGAKEPGTFWRMGIELPRFPEPGGGDLMNLIAATWDAMMISSKLNKSAAVWTAASVVLNAASALVSSLA
jgi:hypothetical protein